MHNMRHSIEINASSEKVWKVLWDDQTFRDWANIIDEETYMTGILQEGAEVNFIGSSDGGARYGVTSRIEKLIPNKYILFTRIADIVLHPDGRIDPRDKQWTGCKESYELTETNGRTKLTITQDVPDELFEYFNSKLPQVLERVKVLAEMK